MASSEFLNIVDFSVSLCHEMIEKGGEDSFFSCVRENKAIVSVFDGCGGLDGKNYQNFSFKTGAYMASRILSGAMKAWFDNVDHVDVDAYKSLADKTYGIVSQYADRRSVTIKGSMHKDMASTLCAAVVQPKGNDMHADFIWAGDSRGYIFSPEGLVQMTQDDIRGEDAMSNLKNDGVLTNVAYSGGGYTVHKRSATVTYPAIVLCATDGCFGYMSTPMEFEYLLLKTLFESKCAQEWKEKIDYELKEISCDDYTLSLISLGFGSFEKLKEAMKDRKAYMEDQYIARLQDLSYEEKVSLWEKYKEDYYV